MDAKVKRASGVHHIFDRFRKKYVQLTPEEWVRQHFAMALMTTSQVPESLIMLESEIGYGHIRKRPDIVIMNTDQTVWLLVECKAPTITLDEQVWQQTFTYGSVLKPKMMAVTNGLEHIICEFQPEKGKFVLRNGIPKFTKD